MDRKTGSGHRATRTAQDIARRCGIHPNDAANGVWLPKNEAERAALNRSEVPHSMMHTRHYNQNINRIMFQNYYSGSLDSSSRCARVHGALKAIKEALKDGSFAF